MAIITDNWVMVEAYYGGAWNVLTTDLDDVDNGGRIEGSSGVTITRGKAATAQRANPSQCDFTIFNRDGKYISRNPRSPLWGLLPKNTPVRVKAGPITTYLDFAGRGWDQACYATDSAALDITGDLEIRVDIEMRHSVTAQHLISKYITSNQRSYALYTIAGGFPQLVWTPDGLVGSRVFATCSQPIPSGRFSLKVQLDVNNGAGGNTVTFYTASSINGTYTQLGSAVVQSGVTSIFNSTSDLELGSGNVGGLIINGAQRFRGKFYGYRLYNNLSGTVTVTGDFTNLDIEATSYSDGTTTTRWNSQFCDVGTDQIRFSGSIPKWPVSRDTTGRDVRTQITAYGVFQELSEGATTIDSAMKRMYSNISTMIGYWTGETEGILSATTPNTQFASASGIKFAAADVIPGSEPVFTIDENSRVRGIFPSIATSTAHSFTFATYLDKAPSLNTPILVYATAHWQFSVNITNTVYQFNFVANDGTVLATPGAAFGTGAAPGQPIIFVLEVIQNGANVDYAINWRTADPNLGYALSGSLASTKSSVPRQWSIPGLATGHGLTTCAIGHIAADNSVDHFLESPHLQSFRGYAGETAGERIYRLCGEQGVYAKIRGDKAFGAKCGPQPVDTFMNILDDTANVDRGILGEIRHRRGVEYTTRQELENQAAFSIAYSNNLSDAEVDEFPNTYNDVTVTRKNGGSARSVTTTGAKSVATIGTYEFPSATLNLYEDDQLADVANFIRIFGSWDEYQWKNLLFQMARPILFNNAANFTRIQGLDVGRGLTLTGLPNNMPVRPAETMIEQYTEVLKRLTWDIQITETSPMLPRKMADYLDLTTRIDSIATVTSGSLTTSATSMTVTGNAIYTRWKYPGSNFQIMIDNREIATVTNITGTAPNYTFTITRGTPSFAHASGVSVNLYDRRYLSFR